MWLIMPPLSPSQRHPPMFPAAAGSPRKIHSDDSSNPAVSMMSETIREEASAGFRPATGDISLKTVVAGV